MPKLKPTKSNRKVAMLGRTDVFAGAGWDDAMRQHSLFLSQVRKDRLLPVMYAFCFRCLPSQRTEAEQLAKRLRARAMLDFPGIHKANFNIVVRED